MLGVGEETPSRFDLLSIVKKHSNLLGKTVVEEEDASDVEMDGQFWHDVFDLYFVRGKESKRRQDDDLLFFVRKWREHGFNDKNGVAPYFVRRWALELDKLVGESFSEVDWRRSFYLNMIAHISYSVTVAICSQQVLRNRQVGQDTPLSSIYKEVETTPAYPDICFAIDDFDSTFDAVDLQNVAMTYFLIQVLTDTDLCYCVLLNALDGAGFPSETDKNDSCSSNKLPLGVDTNSTRTKNCKVWVLCQNNELIKHSARSKMNLALCCPLTLFSGFVSYQMVRDAYDDGHSRFGSFLSVGHSSGKTDRLYMKGPGGRGEVEVAVSGVADQSKQYSGPFSPIKSKRGLRLGSMFRKAASVVSLAAKHVYAAAAATSTSDEEMIPLKCCLMSITLPWEHIAHDLLFKWVAPPGLPAPEVILKDGKGASSSSSVGTPGHSILANQPLFAVTGNIDASSVPNICTIFGLG
ncbi:hypothetical protein GOBAR_AA23682 [Gossypium barbadense]|uniref:Uncharacterized protein n=1 Tax=Gossypium barbadense TaxID=3634 RepID=A0A2P5X0V8_GOSBA|nr:hypothetical protein GOBAR_AA23682 [Gossypium barbadense]